MRYLSVEQALADVAQVITHLQETAPGPTKRKVITFGGSYSGALSAWFRQQYPNITSGSISSSGVVHSIVNFTAFDEVVDEAIGSKCSANVRRHVAALERMFSNADTKDATKRTMGASNLIGTKLGDKDFWYMVADGVAMADQYGGKERLCSSFSNIAENATDAELVTSYATFLKSYWGDAFPSGCFYDGECLIMQGHNFSNNDMSRSWRWQKCSQLAYLQPSYARDPIRSSQLTLSDELEQCEYIFGRKFDIVKRSREINMKFGAASPTSGSLPATNIYYLDFSDDPWKAASVDPKSVKLPYCMTTCAGCGHCGAGVPKSLEKVCIDKQDDYITEWLK